MEKKCALYTAEDISRFIDHELSSEQCRSFEHHLPHCRNCSELVDQFRSLSFIFSRHAHRKTMGIEAENIKHKLEKTLPAPEKKQLSNFSGLFGKSIYLKLASVATLIMIGLFPFAVDLLKEPSAGPSAIVTSVDTEYASVMIIETQEGKHTIIWFSEET